MKFGNLVLGSILIAMPAASAMAQYAGNPPQYSSPAARAETRALNRNAADGTCASPAMLNGEIPPAAAAREPDRCQRYEARMERYNENRRDYDMRMRAYAREMTRYRAMRRHWYEEQTEY
jgi:hypothetical protein